MSNLFVVFTPFQLFIAQQLVHQEKLTDCILIESYVKGNRHFLDIYNMMEMEGMWAKKIIIPDFAQWDGLRTKSIMDEVRVYKAYKNLWKLIKSNHVGALYLGEMQNNAIRFTDVVFHHKGIKIIFFEEGSAHYIQRPYSKETRWMKVKEFVRDLVEYLPLYHVRFAKWRYVPNRPVQDGLPMDERFSVIEGIYNETFDRKLFPQHLMSNKLKGYIKGEIADDEKRVLLMTDPIFELIGTENMYLYFDTIRECFEKLPNDTKVYIKYHPRDSKESREQVEQIAREYNLNYEILCQKVNIPVEYILQLFSFEEVFVFNASTYFYNGKLYPQIKYHKLIPMLYQKGIAAGLDDSHLGWLKKFDDEM